MSYKALQLFSKCYMVYFQSNNNKFNKQFNLLHSNLLKQKIIIFWAIALPSVIDCHLILVVVHVVVDLLTLGEHYSLKVFINITY